MFKIQITYTAKENKEINQGQNILSLVIKKVF